MKEASEGPFAKGEEKNAPKSNEKYVVIQIRMHVTEFHITYLQLLGKGLIYVRVCCCLYGYDFILIRIIVITSRVLYIKWCLHSLIYSCKTGRSKIRRWMRTPTLRLGRCRVLEIPCPPPLVQVWHLHLTQPLRLTTITSNVNPTVIGPRRTVQSPLLDTTSAGQSSECWGGVLRGTSSGHHPQLWLAYWVAGNFFLFTNLLLIPLCWKHFLCHAHSLS